MKELMVMVTACAFMNMKRSWLSHSQGAVYEKTDMNAEKIHFFFQTHRRSVHEQAS